MAVAMWYKIKGGNSFGVIVRYKYISVLYMYMYLYVLFC